ncbi:MAG: hypothetical protein ACE5GY_02800, partial [Thermodesulfobacteriota bacterium]
MVRVAVVAVCLLLSGAAFAGGHGFNTGDKELDVTLGKLNIDAKADKGNFIKSLSAAYKVPEKDIRALISKEGMRPADVYMAVRLSRMSKRPLGHVVRVYKGNKGKGWGVVARRLGIEPGSKEFHVLRKGVPAGKRQKHGNKHGNKHG